MCNILGIKRSSYYAWLKRPPSERQLNDEKLVKEIKRVHKESYGTYGARRIKAQLDSDGIKCSKNKVSKLMKENNIFSKITRKFKATTYSNHNYNIAPNLLKQDFNVEVSKKAYVWDITYIATEEGWLYLATVIDLFDRCVVGWSMNSTMTRKLVIDAFNSAILKENPEEGFIFHSDRGVQYASYDYQNLLKDNGCIQSMSDFLYGRKFKTRSEARQAVVEYIELFYNSKRLHSSLGYKSPKEYRKSYYDNINEAA
ncbi:MAG: transposase [Clostridium sp. 27_14]|nr:MAG: transposase [Clostridium sp. 27_14]